MSPALHLLVGALLPLPAWLWLRRGARASAWMLLDAAPLVAGFCALLALTARPVLAGGLVGGACIFLIVADSAKRAALAEPLAFSDGGMLWQVPVFPRFYLPFVPRAVLVTGIGGGVATFIAVVVLEPGLTLGGAARLALLSVAIALAALVLRPLALLRGTAIARDLERDAARFGPLATFALHARLAAVERAARRAAHPPAPAIVASDAPRPHLVLLQLESFCDPRRLCLHQALPNWDALAAEAIAHGRLLVPNFGANTMRTEFVVLTGIDDAALGLDRFDPFFRFARAPVTSLAWALRGAGWTTACLHPHDGRFFGRDQAMPALGFERLEDGAAFTDAPRAAGFVTDAALGARIVAELEAAADPVFLCAITIAAHGPWPGPDPAARWAALMAQTDAMIGAVAQAARRSARPVVIAAFGDHRPSLPAARGATDTDYLIWRSDVAAGGAARDLDAAALHRALRVAVGIGAR